MKQYDIGKARKVAICLSDFSSLTRVTVTNCVLGGHTDRQTWQKQYISPPNRGET